MEKAAVVSTHIQIINAIHVQPLRPFSVSDIQRASGVSTSSVVRALRLLTKMGFLSYATKRSFAGRQYRHNRWPSTVEEAIESFTFIRMLER